MTSQGMPTQSLRKAVDQPLRYTPGDYKDKESLTKLELTAGTSRHKKTVKVYDGDYGADMEPLCAMYLEFLQIMDDWGTTSGPKKFHAYPTFLKGKARQAWNSA